MDILDILKEDYKNFPDQQTYSIYAQDVYFKDPVYEYWGCDRYQKMIAFIKTWFADPKLDLHSMERKGDEIRTEWMLSWTSPLLWKPRIHIQGWSELKLNPDGLISSHIDYWNCSRLDVIKQHFGVKS